MMKINKKVEELQFSGIAKVIEKANTLGNDVIRLEVGDVDLDCPKEIQDGINEAFDNKKTHYPPLRGNQELIGIITNEAKEKINSKISESNVMITPGGSMGMFYIFSTILNDGDEVILFEPLWPHLKEMIKCVGAIPVSIGLHEEDNFHINFDDLKAKINNNTKAILINTPNNPTGVIYNEEELKTLAGIAQKYDLYIISDEEYCDYHYNDNNFKSPMNFYTKTLISRSYSKQYSIAGLRIGYVIGNEEIMKQMEKFALFTAMYSSSIVQYAIANKKDKMEYFINNARQIMSERMQILFEGLNDIKGLSCKKPEGGLYIWLRCKEIEEDDKKFADRLLYNAKVATVPGSCFGESGKGYLRVSLGAEKEKIMEAIKRIKEEIENGD